MTEEEKRFLFYGSAKRPAHFSDIYHEMQEQVDILEQAKKRKDLVLSLAYHKEMDVIRRFFSLLLFKYNLDGITFIMNKDTGKYDFRVLNSNKECFTNTANGFNETVYGLELKLIGNEIVTEIVGKEKEGVNTNAEL